MYIHICIHICIHMHAYIYMYVYIYICVYMYLHICVYTFVYIYVYTHMSTYIYIYTHTHFYIYTHTHTHTHIMNHIHLHLKRQRSLWAAYNLWVTNHKESCDHICKDWAINKADTHAHTHSRTHTHTNTRTHATTNTGTHAHAHAHTHTLVKKMISQKDGPDLIRINKLIHCAKRDFTKPNAVRFFLAASAVKFWKRDISSASESAFPVFLGNIFGYSTSSKKRCFSTQEFTRFLSTV